MKSANKKNVPRKKVMWSRPKKSDVINVPEKSQTQIQPKINTDHVNSNNLS